MAHKLIPKICVSGGPCGGKSTGLSIAAEKLSNCGIRAFVAHEAATELKSQGFHVHDHSPVEYQLAICKRSIEIEDACVEQARAVNSGERCVVLTDRGLMDVKAYVEEEDFEKIRRQLNMSEIDMRDKRYDAVMFMRSVAYDAHDLYTCENNKERTETVGEARVRDERTLDAWIGHPHLRTFDNSVTFRTKVQRMVQTIFNVLGMPEPLEIENKYLVPSGFDLSLLPSSTKQIEIVQHYLKSKGPHEEERVRVRKQGDGRMYIHTVKRTIEPGVRIEIEHQITREKFNRLLMKRADPNLASIRKTRHCFVFENQYFELDRFHDRDLILLEIELTKQNSTVTLPPFLKSVVSDVTHDKKYSNYELARQIVAQRVN